MKKKFIAVSMVLGALALSSTTLTSCVDDNESASVTAIRDAKAAQLNALAAASNADAELKKAKALVQQANAAKTEQETAEAQQRFEIELEALKAKYEQKLLDWQKQIAKANADLRGEVYNNYVNAVNKLQGLESQYITASSTLAAAKVGLTSAEKFAQQTILTQQEVIAQNEAKIEAYKTLGTNDRDALLQQIEELDVQINAQKNDITKKLSEETAKQDAFDESTYAYAGNTDITPASEPTLETGKAIDFLRTAIYEDVLNFDKVSPEDESANVVIKYSLLQSKVESHLVTLKDEVENKTTALGKETDEAAASVDEAGKSAWAKYNFLKKDYEAKKKAYDDAAAADKPGLKSAMDLAYQAMLAAQEPGGIITLAKAKLASAEENLTKFNEAVAAFSGEAYTAYEAAIDATLKAREEWKAAYDAYTESTLAKAELEGERSAAYTLLSANPDIDALIAQCEQNIADANVLITNAQEFASTAVKAYKAKTWNNGEPYRDINGNIIKVGTPINGLYQFDPTSTNTWDGYGYLDQNGTWVSDGSYVDGNDNKVYNEYDAAREEVIWYTTTSAKAYLAECESELANLESQIEAQKAIVAQCKAEMDAVLNSTASTTPAE
ncbi:hypothetical protein [Bacteroides mediterraneensis]|uniref:hypothetical protein n=1 Tax=Bacteroides mediterraneensis TaxID=1841856 RepID=UPI0026ED01E8|nr:hypothetical protein [Bacteroides mediterraneensis]